MSMDILFCVYIGFIVSIIVRWIIFSILQAKEEIKLCEKYNYQVVLDGNTFYTNSFQDNNGKVVFENEDKQEVILFNPIITKLHCKDSRRESEGDRN